MADAKKKAGRGRPASPSKKMKGEVIVNQMNVRINKQSYIGDMGDKVDMPKFVYEKLSELGFVK